MAKEIEEIFEHIRNKCNFLLSGGAGSGKTYSLVEVVKRIYAENPLSRIACITYTNVAANEIKERVPYELLRVSTIHDFLWDIISSYQLDLMKALVQLIQEDVISHSGPDKLDLDYFKSLDKKIEYKEWKSLKNGIVSHDEVIALSEYLFANNKLLADIVKDKYDFILVDEYQDTFISIIDILLKHLQQSPKINIIGFFGDAMQSIYDNGVGDIKLYINNGLVKEVVKPDNRRNPQKVIDLINQLRSDGLTQVIANDPPAQNLGIAGSIKFLYTNSESYDIDKIKGTEYFNGWDFNNSQETKELYLVHKLIANKAGFTNLMDIYNNDGIINFKNTILHEIKEKNIEIDESKTFGEVIEIVGKSPTKGMKDFINGKQELYQEAKEYPFKNFKNIYLDKDQLIGDKKISEDLTKKKGEKRDALIKHLFNIQECSFLYRKGRYNEFIKKTQYPIISVKSKIELKKTIETLVSMENNTIGEVIDFAHDTGVWKKDDQITEFIQEKEYVYNRVVKVKFKEIICVYEYIEGYTPYSTQHNIKGTEFDNVFVVLDNGGWRNYNFEYLFVDTPGKESVINRTQKLFYVCCSRSKKNLIVFFHKPIADVIAKAEGWFGKENVHLVDN
jgi:DNA helicase-2/ATP-dependent DNA helicase PcrA